MPSSTFYINGPTLSLATAVFTDAAMTVCAADGYYSDGSVVRYQSSCSLLPEAMCPDCIPLCGDNNIEYNVTPGIGLIHVYIDTGSALGAIVVRFNPYTIPIGFISQFGMLSYNGFSSNLHGWLQGTANLPTFVGETALDCGIVAGSPYTLDEYAYQGTGFVPLMTTASASVGAGQMQTTTVAPTQCVMVIPKLDNTFTIVNNMFYSICGSPGQFDIEVACPAPLYNWKGGKVKATATEACLTPADKTYYYVHVNGSGGVLGLYDIVFSDPNGQSPLTAGYYSTGSMSGSWSWVEVDANGVVISFGSCYPTSFYGVKRCFDALSYAIIGVPAPLSLGDFVELAEYPGCVWYVFDEPVGPATATFLQMSDGCDSQCSSFGVKNTSSSPVELIYTDCDGNAVSGIFIAGNDKITVCARQFDPVLTPPELDVTWNDCECLYTFVYKIALCGDPSVEFIASSTYAIDPSFLVQITINEYKFCWFEIVEESTDYPTTNITSDNNGAFNCNSTCVRYELENTDVVNIQVNYTTCDSTPSNITLFPGGTTTICALANSLTWTGSLNVELIACDCTT